MSGRSSLTVDQVSALVASVQMAGARVEAIRQALPPGSRLGRPEAHLAVVVQHLEAARESLWTLLGMVVSTAPERPDASPAVPMCICGSPSLGREPRPDLCAGCYDTLDTDRDGGAS
jgi:hypothetical protein